MSNQKAIKTVTKEGRVLIPKEYRDYIGIAANDSVIIDYGDGDKITIERKKDFSFTGAEIRELEIAAQEHRLIVVPEWPIENGMITGRYEILETMVEKKLILLKDRLSDEDNNKAQDGEHSEGDGEPAANE